jgi:molybdate transport system substrate-binding protein
MDTASFWRVRLRILTIVVVAIFALFGRASAAESPRSLTILAAASLTDALQQIGAKYQAVTGTATKFSFGASSALARQIEAGARADLFVSADSEWMDYLDKRRLIRPATRKNLLGNRLVLIAPADSNVALAIAPKFGLRAALGQGRLATGDPDSVPVGRYARAALTALGVWDSVSDRLVRADNVRGALMFVARGEAPLGIVYATDARIDPGVRVVDVFPPDSHPPIVYPVALTSSASGDAEKFEAFLGSPEAKGVFVALGFTVALP